MAKQWWKIETTARVRRQYEVFAESETEAKDLVGDSSHDHQEDIDETIVSVVPSGSVSGL